MSSPVTIQDIYNLFQASQEKADRLMAESKAEADRRAAEADRRAAEADRRAAELQRLMAESKAEADRLMAESKAEADRLMAESKAEADRRAAESKAEADRMMAESKAEADRRAAESKAEADRRAAESKAEADRRTAELERLMAESKAEADRSMAELKKTVDRTSKAVDALTTRWGRFVEELVEPAILRLFQGRGIDIKEVHPRVRTKRQGLAMEIDVLGVDDTDLVVVECKSRLSKEDVDEFLEKLRRFKQSFPHYANYRAYGAVAGIEINEGIDRYAYRQGLFVIKPSGEGVAIANDEEFEPVAW